VFETVTLVVLALILLGIVGSVVPGVPAGLLALAGVYVEFLYGVHGMSVWLLAGFTVVGLVAMAVDYFGGALVARSQGASTKTTLLAGAVGLVLILFTGPLGAILGVFATVLALELRRDQPFDEALNSAVWSFAGMLGSGLVVFLLLVSMLVGYVWLVL
jgi:uncharacterized protein YqgC (DUF456 family)